MLKVLMGYFFCCILIFSYLTVTYFFVPVINLFPNFSDFCPLNKLNKGNFVRLKNEKVSLLKVEHVWN